MAVLPLRPRVAVPEALPSADALSRLSERQRAAALDLEALLKPAIERMAGGIAAKSAAQWLAAQADGLPSWKSIERHLNAYKKGGVAALADGRTGKQRTVRGWEARAVRLFAQPQQPSYATVAYWLRQEGFADAREDLVRAYLKKCPSNLTETAPARLGKHYYNQNIRPHVVRDATVLDVGFVYEGDGHCCDVYVAHPATGRAFRPELTTWLDVRSHFCVSWWLSESESAQTTLFSLSQALVVHDHVPAFVHSDPGSGFIARIVSDDVSGFLSRFDITQMTALPGNARGKGLQEGWFRWFEERCGKRFATYCGHDRTDDYLRRLGDRVKLGKIVLPTLSQYADAIRAYIEAYNHTPQKGLGNKSPADLWATLQRTPLETPAAAVVRPRKVRTVEGWSVRLDNRKYRGDELAQFETREVLVEYSLHDDGRVWVLDLEGRFVAEVGLVEKTPWLPDSRIEEAKQRRLEGQQKRLQRAMDEAQARSVQPISTSDFLDSIAAPEAPALPAAAPALIQGHDFTPSAPKPERKPRALDAQAHAATVAELAAEPVPMETAQQRFARYQRLSAARDAGAAMTEPDASWLAIYETTPECAACRMVFDDLGGAPDPNPNQNQE